VDFVDEQNVAGVQVGQQRRKVAGLFNGRAGGDTDVHAHFVGDNARQRGFAQTGRAVQQGVIQRFSTPPGGFNINREISLGLFLPGVVGKELRPQTDLPRILRREGGGNNGGIQFLRKFETHNLPPRAESLFENQPFITMARRAKRTISSVLAPGSTPLRAAEISTGE